jgi:putative aldouronate transport system permease protein
LFNGDFGLFYQTTRDVGTLYPTTDIINTYVFRGLMGGNMSISAAVGFFQSFVGILLVGITNSIIKRIDPENSLF